MSAPMSTNDMPLTILDLFIVGAVIFWNKIYALLLFVVTHDLIRTILVDIQQVTGAIVGILGMYLMFLRIKKVKKQTQEINEKK